MPTKVVEPIVKVIAQPIKPIRIPLRYPCIIYFNFEYRALDCFINTKVQKMFQTKPTTIAIIVPKPYTYDDNVPVNVVAIVTTHNQVLDQ